MIRFGHSHGKGVRDHRARRQFLMSQQHCYYFLLNVWSGYSTDEMQDVKKRIQLLEDDLQILEDYKLWMLCRMCQVVEY